MFGYTKTMEGTLTFDDENNRLLFKDKKPPKEIHIPYDAITSAFADTQKRQPAAATVASHVPHLHALPAGFIKTKVRYLTLQYSDPDSKAHAAIDPPRQKRQQCAGVCEGDGGTFAFGNRLAARQFRQTPFDAAREVTACQFHVLLILS